MVELFLHKLVSVHFVNFALTLTDGTLTSQTTTGIKDVYTNQTIKELIEKARTGKQTRDAREVEEELLEWVEVHLAECPIVC